MELNRQALGIKRKNIPNRVLRVAGGVAVFLARKKCLDCL